MERARNGSYGGVHPGILVDHGKASEEMGDLFQMSLRIPLQ